MPKRTRSGRVKGYHYAVDRNGKRYRVYPSALKTSRRPATSTSRKGVRSKARSTASRLASKTDYFGDVIMGYGQYHLKRRGTRSLREPGIPRVQNSSDGVIVRHKEFLSDVPSSIGFSSFIIPLNPGLPDSFPWFSRVAQNFEEWKPRGIIVEYRTTSSDTLLAANPALGSVIIATQYNSVNPDFVNKQQMENYEGAISCKPSVSMIHQVETAKAQMVQDCYYTRVEAPPANADIRMYDIGKVQVATVGSQANGNLIGEIWISYEIELRKPKIPADPIVESAHFILTAAGVANETPLRPFGNTSATLPAGGFLPTSGSTMQDARVANTGSANGVIQFGQFSRGAYLVVCNFPWTTPGSQGAWTVTAAAGCVLVNAWNNNSATASVEVDAATATAATTNLAFIVNVTAAYATVTITNSSTATGGYNGAADVYITELPDVLN